MRTPTEYEIENLFHYAVGYDPVAAKEYYERTKKLKGRRRAQPEKIYEDDPRWDPTKMGNKRGRLPDPRTGKTREQISKDARARQRKEVQAQIKSLGERVDRLQSLLKEREAEEKADKSKSKAKKERAAKEADKPKTAAEKAEAARDSEKYRDKNQQKLKSKGDGKKSGEGSDDKKKATRKHTSSELRTMITKAKGQLAMAKLKLAAL